MRPAAAIRADLARLGWADPSQEPRAIDLYSPSAALTAEECARINALRAELRQASTFEAWRMRLRFIAAAALCMALTA